MSVDIQKIAEQLYQAERGGYELEKISAANPDMKLEDSYEIQKRLCRCGWMTGKSWSA